MSEENNKKNNYSKDNTKKEKKPSTIRRKIVIALILLVLVIGYIVVRGSYLEMLDLGENYVTVFWQKTMYISIIFIINFILLYCSFYLTNRTIKKGLKVFFDEENREMPKFPNKSICFIIALFGSIISTIIFYNKFMLGISNTQFGINDPVFNIDISFMILTKPLIQYTIVYLLAVVIATLAYSALFSIIVINKSLNGVSREALGKYNLTEKVASRIKIIAVLVAFFVIFFMVTNIGNEKFMGIELSDGSSYSLYGAGKADATVKLVGYAILALIAMISILLAYKNIKKSNIRGVIGDILIVPVYLIGLAIILAVYQIIFIGNETLASNQEYISANIDFTKQAYGINADYNSIDYSGTITENEIGQNANLLKNIDIATKENVLQDFQTTKGYYNYRNTQIEQYNSNGVETLMYVTPREISDQNTTYKSRTYQYTHGNGDVFTIAGATSENGYLITLENNEEEAGYRGVNVTKPQIYYGLETDNIAIVNSKLEEIDYVNENSNEEMKNSYDGKGGLQLNFFDRLVLAVKKGDLQLAFSGEMKQDSKILLNRNIIDRAKSVMPYIKYDDTPYMVINDAGEQYWVIDAYTVSDSYPFSQKSNFTELEEINYIRNSVKVIVNAYDGTMKFYITDRNDPIIMAYNNLYPTLFASAEEKIPEDISKHFVYPEKLYNIQAKMIEQYHNVKTEVFYRGNDIWQIAQLSSNKNDTMTPYYTMVKNSKGEDSLGLVLPYTPYGKQNLAGYFIGTVEDGKPVLRISSFSYDDNVLGPIQIQTQINQDENIASEIASLNTTGARIKTKISAIPINNTMLYVETIYQQLINETTQKPTLKRVVVASGNKIAIGNNIQQALNNLLSQYAVNIEVGNTDNMNDIVKGIIKAHENLKNSSKSSDWKLFGEDMEALSNLVEQLKKVVEDQQKTNTTVNNQVTFSNEIINNTVVEQVPNTTNN